jgi:hypothetical protein
VTLIGFCFGLIVNHLVGKEQKRINVYHEKLKDLHAEKVAKCYQRSASREEIAEHDIDPEHDHSNIFGAHRSPLYRLGPLALLIIVIFAGAGVVHSESLSFSDACYFLIITLTTVGYGDIHPETGAGKTFVSIYVLFGCGAFGWFASSVMAIPLANRHKKIQQRILQQYGHALQPSELRELVSLSSCNKGDFIVMMLLETGIVHHRDVLRCVKSFEILDRNRDGILSKEDIQVER